MRPTTRTQSNCLACTSAVSFPHPLRFLEPAADATVRRSTSQQPFWARGGWLHAGVSNHCNQGPVKIRSEEEQMLLSERDGSLEMFCHSKWNSSLKNVINYTCIERQFYGGMAARVSCSKSLLIRPTGVRQALSLSNIIIPRVFWASNTMSISSVKHYVVNMSFREDGQSC